jgi:hypothetical protein
VTARKPLAVFTCLLLSGCATLGGKATASSSCPFEQVWDTAIAALSDFHLSAADKAAGVLETQWVEVRASTQAGIIQREVNRERMKYVVEVKQEGTGAVATVLQRREEWSPLGVRSRQWRGIPSHDSEEEAVAAEMTRRLKEKGC